MGKLFTVVVALALSACGITAPGGSLPAPAPLAKATIDDTALITADRGFDVALDAINLLTDMGKIKPGTPRAKQIATAIRKVDSALDLAASFAAAGHAASYKDALLHAQAGITELRALLKGN